MIPQLWLYTWRDGLELGVCILAYLYINRWLYYQEDKKPLCVWYSYHACVVAAYVLDLSTLFFLLGSCFPLVIMLLILSNETRLSKMFVVAQRIDPLLVTTHESPWVDELFKFMLLYMNQQKDFTVVIERNDQLSTLIRAQELIHTDIRASTLELLYDSFTLSADMFAWVNSAGKLVCLAAQWKHLTPENSAQVTEHTDACMVISSAVTRRFTVITHAKIITNISAHHALNLVKELVEGKQTYVQKAHVSSYNDTLFS